MYSLVEFQARGERGDEIIRVTVNGGKVVLLQQGRLSKAWRAYKFRIFGSLRDVQIYLAKIDVTPPSSGVLYIRDGVVKFYRSTLFGRKVFAQDILNVRATYRALNGLSDPRASGRELFAEDSEQMATVRSGITGWLGYYELITE